MLVTGPISMLRRRLATSKQSSKKQTSHLAKEQVIHGALPALVKGLREPSHEITGAILHYFPEPFLEIVMEQLFPKDRGSEAPCTCSDLKK
jgi:hypothetical protein